MKTFLIRFLAVFYAVSACQAVTATEITQPTKSVSIAKLVDWCKSEQPDHQLACGSSLIGWLNGFQSTEMMTSNFLSRQGVQLPRMVCLPEKLTIQQARRVFLGYVEDRVPERRRNQQFGVSLFIAFARMYPCYAGDMNKSEK
ncbi:Rap1a/Tai family immunity protein [Sphingorhabdus sp. EL138]|uniref:Rap1a/Tai family immunity protein n=1 Tax=Sphingorhabdus sp. EL138 TaxID=2073156 RepID=UPI000D699603|nr:Rap1a/Tai family immunity protein [Sphingorhabdus sp. EL138]